MKGWFRIKSAAEYCDVSTKTFRGWLKQGLPHSRLERCVLINRTELDQWLERHAVDVNQVDEIVDRIMEGL